jgi:hypothetical protein
MKATRKSSITDSPSTCWPIVSSRPPFCHHVQDLMTGATYGSA